MIVKFVNLENGGHEKEQVYRSADHWFHHAVRGGLADQGTVPQKACVRTTLRSTRPCA